MYLGHLNSFLVLFKISQVLVFQGTQTESNLKKVHTFSNVKDVLQFGKRTLWLILISAKKKIQFFKAVMAIALD